MMNIDVEPTPTPPPDEDQVRDVLRQVIDPEVGVNIVALGLIYRIAASATRVEIDMTMTSPACPMGEMIVDDVRAVLQTAFPRLAPAVVRLVWEPPWQPSMMDDSSRQHFGW